MMVIDLSKISKLTTDNFYSNIDLKNFYKKLNDDKFINELNDLIRYSFNYMIKIDSEFSPILHLCNLAYTHNDKFKKIIDKNRSNKNILMYYNPLNFKYNHKTFDDEFRLLIQDIEPATQGYYYINKDFEKVLRQNEIENNFLLRYNSFINYKFYKNGKFYNEDELNKLLIDDLKIKNPKDPKNIHILKINKSSFSSDEFMLSKYITENITKDLTDNLLTEELLTKTQIIQKPKDIIKEKNMSSIYGDIKTFNEFNNGNIIIILDQNCRGSRYQLLTTNTGDLFIPKNEFLNSIKNYIYNKIDFDENDLVLYIRFLREYNKNHSEEIKIWKDEIEWIFTDNYKNKKIDSSIKSENSILINKKELNKYKTYKDLLNNKKLLTKIIFDALYKRCKNMILDVINKKNVYEYSQKMLIDFILLIKNRTEKTAKIDNFNVILTEFLDSIDISK